MVKSLPTKENFACLDRKLDFVVANLLDRSDVLNTLKRVWNFLLRQTLSINNTTSATPKQLS